MGCEIAEKNNTHPNFYLPQRGEATVRLTHHKGEFSTEFRKRFGLIR
ncbi:hypothetical protein LMG28688_04944 [Paraburkholderia caffeinitolerans]|uniref:Uncharacterized protein n=1 Tax=Paraburkholderia caffeinitolerans TaxID=1723730 RepID=A0A6J5GIC8_9BURK|nr:hypothetical protein LMG28688_04944 [Paraburkholderia caffeinitolerans]